MRIEKSGVAITNVDEWLEHAGPTIPGKQWVEGRSAMEAARAWLEGAPNGPPKEIDHLPRSHTDSHNVNIDEVEPEARVNSVRVRAVSKEWSSCDGLGRLPARKSKCGYGLTSLNRPGSRIAHFVRLPPRAMKGVALGRAADTPSPGCRRALGAS